MRRHDTLHKSPTFWYCDVPKDMYASEVPRTALHYVPGTEQFSSAVAELSILRVHPVPRACRPRWRNGIQCLSKPIKPRERTQAGVRVRSTPSHDDMSGCKYNASVLVTVLRMAVGITTNLVAGCSRFVNVRLSLSRRMFVRRNVI